VDILSLSIIGFLIAFVANLAHWNGRRNERCTYYPPRGWMSVAYIMWASVAGITMVMCAFRVVPLSVPAVLGLTCMVAIQLHSIWFRSRRRQAFR
jgi:hypothetical protein